MEAVIGVCGHCRRPNDELEIERGLALARERRQAVRKWPMRLAAWAAVLVVAVAAYARRDVVERAVAVARIQLNAALDRAGESGAAAPATAPAPLPQPAPAPRAPGPDEWALSGRVFDLKTLKPLRGSPIVFISPERALSRAAQLDDLGGYRVILPKNTPQGFTVRVDEDAYVPYALGERDIPYAQLTEADRKQLIDVALDGDAPPSRVLEPDEPRASLDLFVAPR
jgi:hypothetical protein